MKISSLGLTLCAMALAAGSAYANVTPNVEDASGKAVKDASGACVVTSGRNLPECSPAKAPAPAAPSAPAQPSAPASPATPAPAARPAPASVRQAVVIQADALFDFDKSVVRPDGKKSIDEALAKLKGVDLEMVIATGHTDSVGSDAYNQKLSERRAATVRDYLASQGVPKDKIETLGMGKTQPVPGVKCEQRNRKELIECLQPHRRVEVEVKGEMTRR